ncbi:putative unusual protein kinase regulating ubiquinone biosynthesis (AarF/ABC1/UbiB family) [Yoonia maricola]|uniref:Putative unusual protein kinase regulating ubiquinone biosynthesis (AarF/ABC1/UbiB family) n=1 Tax=Yoonia maricola TaxID=420999 RepID=A0A2M8W590_9RHOB|nr:AarF/ABC1/UbiB kinase family protein [Yoonia maricola]PJI86091.1 putative unusual protein kinase regulating ubiquinone biosynthesis (AarF/ABC1/UbiB family) [Yoonia maricola]
MTDKRDTARALPVPSGRVSRFTRLGAMTAGVAGNMAMNGLSQLAQGQRPAMRDLLMTPQNITRVTEKLAQMRGAAMKIGQLMSMDTGEFLPPELAQIMARLRDDAHIMPPAQLKKVLNANWPAGWLGQFAKFDVRPIAAASIGQVHRARLKDGMELAIKVQYPGVAQSIDSDVANVGALLRMSGLLPKGFELAPYLEEARKQLHLETDYEHESENLARFAALLTDAPAFTVPMHVPEWSTREVLAMSYVAGEPIEAAFAQDKAERNRIADALIGLTLRELFDDGLMQTDPNFANYRYDPATGQIILLDFGATRVLDPKVVDQYRRLLAAGLADEQSTMDAIAEEIGFVAIDTPPRYRAAIMDMMGMAFDALRSDAPFDFTEKALPRAMQDAGMALAEDGFIPPPLPIDVLLLQRKFGGMFLLASQLGAQVDLRGYLRRYVG